jgi:hypothetical protein
MSDMPKPANPFCQEAGSILVSGLRHRMEAKTMISDKNLLSKQELASNTPETIEKMVAKRVERLETAPSSWRGILRRSWTTNTRKTAIKAFCGECMGFDRDGIANCAAWACPLRQYRPFQKK